MKVTSDTVYVRVMDDRNLVCIFHLQNCLAASITLIAFGCYICVACYMNHVTFRTDGASQMTDILKMCQLTKVLNSTEGSLFVALYHLSIAV